MITASAGMPDIVIGVLIVPSAAIDEGRVSVPELVVSGSTTAPPDTVSRSPVHNVGDDGRMLTAAGP